MKTEIALHNISKRFGTLLAVDNVSFEVKEGSLVALLGPSGCGKTTTLRLIAGLEAPDAGEVWLEGRKAAGGRSWIAPEARRVGMVFQDGALFPHLTIAQNILFALNGRSKQERQYKASEQQARVTELLALVNLPGLAERYPHQLSGGQQQRVALARALAANPKLILLDEPFSRLDAALRTSLREEVYQIVKARGATAVFVTHDQEEALSMADRIVVMFDGRVEQVGNAQEIYSRPANRRIATFVGEANFLPGEAHGHWVDCILGRLLLATPHEGAVDILIRPEIIDVEQNRAGSARIERIRYFGHDQVAHLCLNQQIPLMVRSLPRPDLQVGEQVNVQVRGVVMAYPR